MASYPKRRKVLIIEDDANMRRVLFAFLASMRCECMAIASREALATLRQKAFDTVLVDLGASRVSAKQFLRGMQKLRPDLVGKTLAIKGEAVDVPATNLVGSDILPRIPGSRPFEQLMSNLQSLFSPSNVQSFGAQKGRPPRLLFDSFRRQLSSGTRASLGTARELVYRYDDLLVDLQIGPLPMAERVEVVGQVLGIWPAKIKPENLPVVLVSSRGPLAYSSTNRLGDFHVVFRAEDNLAVRIRLGPKSWIETPLRGMGWARKRLSGLSVSGLSA